MKLHNVLTSLTLAGSLFGLAPQVVEAAIEVRADFNGDTFDDLAVGVPGESVDGVNGAGAVNVFYGGPLGLTSNQGTQFWHQNVVSSGIDILDFAEPNNNFGGTLAAGDFNNDGFADLAIGVPFEIFGGKQVGAVQIIYGSNFGLIAFGNQIFNQFNLASSPDAGEGFDLFGAALAVGDFDKDGFDDLAIGVPFEGVGTKEGQGVVQVLYGAGSGLTGSGSQLWHQDIAGIPEAGEPFDFFGDGLVAGDFNKDGIADLAVGARGEDLGTTDAAGAVHVIYGKAGTGLNAANSQLWHQNVAGVEDQAGVGDFFGFPLVAGDFNQDGADDLAIGVFRKDVGGIIADAGAVHILYGGVNRITATNDRVFHRDVAGIEGDAAVGDGFGRTLAAGDFNNDSFADLAVGVDGAEVNGIQNAGSVNVLYGKSGGLSAENDQLWHADVEGVEGTAEANDGFGSALAAGDFNGDGSADLAIGTPFEDIFGVIDCGLMQVLVGKATGLSADFDQIFAQGDPGVGGRRDPSDRFGAALTGSAGAGGGPGLSGEWKSAEEKCTASRCTLKGRLEVTNPGIATAAPSVTEFYLSADEALDESDVLIRKKKLKTLAPGAPRIQRVQVKLAPGQSAEGMFLIAKLDAQNVVPEAREDNNVIVSPRIE